MAVTTPAEKLEVWPLFQTALQMWFKLLPRLSLVILPVLLPICILNEYFPFFITLLPESFPMSYFELVYQVLKILVKLVSLMADLILPIIALHIFHLSYQGAELPSLRKSWQFGYTHLIRYISAHLRATFWILTGLLMLILPGIRRFIRTSFVSIIAVLEEKDAIKKDILSDSKALTEGYEKKIYYMWLYLILFFATYIFLMLTLTFALNIEGEEPWFNVVLELVGTLVNTLLTTAWLPLYYWIKAHPPSTIDV